LKNKRIKVAMAQAGITQSQLAEILQKPESEISIVLNKYELAVREQNDITARIREWDALRKRGA
jgi:hypothetical protein